MNEKIRDLIESTTGVIGEIVAEDVIPALGSEILKGTVLEAATGAVSVISPGLGGVVVAYKQKRWERNWEEYIKLIAKRQDEINSRLSDLGEPQRQEVKDTYFPLISDYVGNERQKEKIEFIVNGFINLISGINMQEDTTLMYYDTLDQLSMLDLRILKLYNVRHTDEKYHDSIYDVMKDYGIDSAQVSMIKKKLLRVGLLLSLNEERMEENVSKISEYVDGLSKSKKNARLKKINKLRGVDSYRITSYGIKFLNFFTETFSQEKNNDKKETQ